MGKKFALMDDDEVGDIGVGCILMFNDCIEEVLLHASEEEAKERLEVLRMKHFRLQSVMYPSMRIDDYDAQYIWHIDYAPIRIYPAKRETNTDDVKEGS